jgi:hypothetical protein
LLAPADLEEHQIQIILLLAIRVLLELHLHLDLHLSQAEQVLDLPEQLALAAPAAPQVLLGLDLVRYPEPLAGMDLPLQLRQMAEML